MKELNEEGFGLALIKKMVANESLRIEWHEACDHTQVLLPPLPTVSVPKLNEYQIKAVNAINQQTVFQTNLIDGVTGSGKTEVYIRLIIEKIKNHKQFLVLVP